jgi:hypothetical protein
VKSGSGGETEADELLAKLTEELEHTEFEVLWKRFTRVKRSWLGRERTVAEMGSTEIMRGPGGGEFQVEAFAIIEEADALRIFLAVQSCEDFSNEATWNFVVQRPDRAGRGDTDS